MEYFNLSNGVKMPKIGFGVFQVAEEECEALVLEAIDAGYRLIDTAQAYGNEAAVGRAIRKSGIPREEFFIVTKISRNVTEEVARKDIKESFENLDLGYIDLALMHMPYGDTYGTWRALESAVESEKVRAIGVSNMDAAHVADLRVANKIIPVVNQIGINPFDQKQADVDYLVKHNVVPMAWGPLAQGNQDMYNSQVLLDIAAAHDKTIAQIVLRWHIQRGVVAIPKSHRRIRMEENINVFDFSLSDDEMVRISELDQKPADFLQDTEFIETTAAEWIRSWHENV